jgi:predicted phage baseplate assembly protein
MALPAPNLDDRRFQELVDDAKRYVQRKCPEWTDHNVSDPGITLIETFAYMTDLMLYRMNRVPDRLYIKFLELVGLQLFPPTAARAPVTFWLSSPAQAPMLIPTNTKVSSHRTDVGDPLVFSTVNNLGIVPCEASVLATQAAGADDMVDRTERSRIGEAFSAFTAQPAVGDALIVGLNNAVPSNCVRLHFRCQIDGVGVDPDFPPLEWQAYSGTEWVTCDVSTDQTGGLNRDGYIDVHVPPSHTVSVRDQIRGGWLRGVVTAPVEGQPAYTSSPLIHGLVAATVGGTIDAVNAELVESEMIGESEGVPGQVFRLHRAPAVDGAGMAQLDVSTDDGWQTWTQVPHFAESVESHLHFTFDAVAGEIRFGPMVRQPDGGRLQYGAVPPKGAFIQIRGYASGGGQAGNVTKGSIQVMRTSIPFVAGVENRYPAIGGVDREDVENAKTRGPIFLRTRSRAVTAEDYEHFTREAAPEIARVRCLPSTGQDAGTVRVLVVPATPVDHGKINFQDLVPSVETLERIRQQLDRVRVIGTNVIIEPPRYQGVTVVARVRARQRANADRIRNEALEALERYFNPLVGGPDGTGWPWGRPVQAGEAFTALAQIDGVEYVEEIRLFGANPVTGERGPVTERLAIDPSSLAFSFSHQVRVEAAT